jgi:hypothetical protein
VADLRRPRARAGVAEDAGGDGAVHGADAADRVRELGERQAAQGAQLVGLRLAHGGSRSTAAA